MVQRDAAWDRLTTITNFGSGNSKSNSLYWAATRPAPVPAFNVTEIPVGVLLPTACSLNSACDAIGELFYGIAAVSMSFSISECRFTVLAC